jgi:pyridinium-3,5-bisthiocarboxylic acid mononucleotide nickel chelatase
VTGDRHAWIDASAGVAGDMLLGALVDAGADLAAVQHAVDAVLPGAVRITVTTVTRAGLRALKVDVDPLASDPPHRTWCGIRDLLAEALDGRVRDRATAVFARLADAEAHVHGVAPEDVHFHEVGALDSVADVVGVCAALEDLDVTTLSAGEVALGSGRVRTAHGDMPVPVPAVAELARGWPVRAGGAGELATPTGMALIRALATAAEDLPPMVPTAVGVGAGGRDIPGRINVVRVLVGAVAGADPGGEPALLLEANVDDMDPRLWPEVLAGLLRSGADDAWLVPIVMKKGRPAHTLRLLCHPDRAADLRKRIVRDTTTLGVREGPVRKYPLPRTFFDVPLAGGTVAVKVAHRDGVIVQVMPEFEDVAALACRLGRAQRLVLQDAAAAAAAAGLTVGARLPQHAASLNPRN